MDNPSTFVIVLGRAHLAFFVTNHLLYVVESNLCVVQRLCYIGMAELLLWVPIYVARILYDSKVGLNLNSKDLPDAIQY